MSSLASYEIMTSPLGPGVHESLCVPSKSGISVSLSSVEFLWIKPHCPSKLNDTEFPPPVAKLPDQRA